MTLFRNTDRRGFMAQALAGSAATMLLAAPARAVAAAPAEFGPLKHVQTSLLDIAYAEIGPANGTPVLLVHGWPYDIHTYAEVALQLAGAGFRVIVPYQRGFGTTRFRDTRALRNGQQAALAVDVLGLMDALGLVQATLAGTDWGARAAAQRD